MEWRIQDFNNNCWKMKEENQGVGLKKSNTDYEFFINKIIKGDYFVLLRYGDGEAKIIQKEVVTANEGWTSKNVESKLQIELEKTLHYTDENIFYGISCPCCDSHSYFWYISQIESSNITFANIWPSNYKRLKNDISKINRKAIFIGNEQAKGKKIPGLDIEKSYYVTNDCFSYWDKNGENLVSTIIEYLKDKKDRLVVACAGPMSEILLTRLYKSNPNNTYIDFGSVFDIEIYNEATRDYHTGVADNRVDWMPIDEKDACDIDVVLTAYKRPEVLKQQLDAILAQSIKPNRILLFQDGIESYYKIVFCDDLLNMFDDVMIKQENCGVWERFEYAFNNSKAKYICLFDDDTIPGNRWLENCYVHMIQNEAVYGTNGVIIKDVEKAEKGKLDIINVGWHVSNEESQEVDFVGHSWFFKREWLVDMISSPYRKKYKNVGEDMCISYVCQKKGIPTIVPPHPIKETSLWGSLPKYGNKFGKDDKGISSVSANLSLMLTALADMHKDGFDLLVNRKPSEVEEAKNKYEDGKNKISQIKKDINSLKQFEGDIYIYGAGDYAKRIIKAVEKSNIHIKGFVVSNKETEEYEGKKVYSRSEYVEKKEKSILILGLNQFYHEEVLKGLDDISNVFPSLESAYSYEDFIAYVSDLN